jgi:spermidine synthase
VIGDIVDVLVPVQRDPGSRAVGSAEPLSTWDAIVLDVDNGPDFLIHQQNATLYSPEFLGSAYQRLRLGGRLAIWCQSESPELLARLSRLAPTAAQRPAPVQRGSRRFDHVIYTLDRPLTCASSAKPEWAHE